MLLPVPLLSFIVAALGVIVPFVVYSVVDCAKLIPTKLSPVPNVPLDNVTWFVPVAIDEP